jgi:hypothetical protein
MDEGHIVVDAVEPIELTAVTEGLARESGFASVADLLDIARHGAGDNVYVIRFHYLPPGGWDLPPRQPPPGQGRDRLPAIRRRISKNR